jgi:DNA-binding IscR family transcriptional regulator
MVSELLKHGKENATTTAALLQALGIKEKRELTCIIEAERNQGIIICSTTGGKGGYYLPKNKQEIAEWSNSMSRRACNTFNAIKGARQALKQYDGQESLEDMLEREQQDRERGCSDGK